MRAVVQRVSRAEVRVGGRVTGRIGAGLLILVGIASEDTPTAGLALAEKIANLRVFQDHTGKMNCSLLDINGSALCISQFTLYGDCRKGRRPNFERAARPEIARGLYEAFVEALRRFLPPKGSGSGRRIETGEFQAMMDVELVNDGPVTLLLDSEKLF
jgi:D-tyrosyl-tRNA(Tyr) deacylase